jgi:hypothetical protein
MVHEFYEYRYFRIINVIQKAKRRLGKHSKVIVKQILNTNLSKISPQKQRLRHSLHRFCHPQQEAHEIPKKKDLSKTN